MTADQLKPEGFEYQRFREFMTNEALAAVRGASAAGAKEIVVADSHGNGESLLIERFPKEVRIVRSWPRHGTMVGALDSSFEALVLIGYHASAASVKGVRAHTFSSAHFTGVALNGQPMSEGSFVAAYAGARGVPVVFVSGDDAAILELRTQIGDIDSVETKQSLSFHSALTLTPQDSADRIFAGVRAALGKKGAFKPYVLKTPVTLDLTYKSYTPAEMMSYLRSVQRVDAHTIRFVGQDMDEVTDFVEVAANYSSDLSP